MPSQPPGAAIATLESFLNTADRYNGTDELGEVHHGGRCLRSIGLLTTEDDLDAAALGVIRDARECLRQLATANTQQRRPRPQRIEELEQMLSVGHLQLGLSTAGSIEASLKPAAAQGALGSVVAGVAAAVYDTVQAGVWQRVKACANEGCQWAFYDRSRSRTGRWCDMRACGNLLKARAYRQRQRGAESS